MNIEKWDKWISIVTNLGVIGGILFLAIELQQNSNQLAAQARYTQFEMQSYDFNRAIFENADLANILIKAENQQSLSEVEALVLNRYNLQIIRNLEFEFMESRRGLIDPNQISLDRWARMFNGSPGLLDVWEMRSAIWQDEFRAALNDALSRNSTN